MKIRNIFISILMALMLPAFGEAATTLSVTPITWNIVGLDSNNPTSGPKYFPVGARVCSSVATNNVVVDFAWDSANANINLRTGSLSQITIPSIGAGACSDAYFEIELNQVAGAYDTTRRYHITATDGSGTASSPTPRELYIEHLVSQSRNGITSVKLNGTSIPAGGAMNLLVGNTYTIELAGFTATQGYNQLESFINFPNTIFQVLSVSTTYTADSNTTNVPNPNSKLYSDACIWENDPNSPNYRSCIGGDDKAGGTVVTTYTVKILSGGGSSQSLNSLFHDFSGSSYHYNADFSVGARIANIIDPSTAAISKSFSPNPTNINGVSALTITITNSNPGIVSGYNFTDPLPTNMTVAATPGATTSGCGTPTFSPVAGAGSISFSNGTIAANSSCVIKVNVTASVTGTLSNTTGHLFVDALDTGRSATADLIVNTDPGPGTGLCGLKLAEWTFAGFTANPPPQPAPSTKASDVPTAAITLGNGLLDEADTVAAGGNPQPGVLTYGWPKTAPSGIDPATFPYIEFAIDTRNYTQVKMQFDAQRKANGPNNDAVYYSTDRTTWTLKSSFSSTTTWTTYGPYDFTGNTSTTGVTYFRIYGWGANATSKGNDLSMDNVSFTGCQPPVKPTIAKSFSPSPVAVNGTSTLTITLTNANTLQLTGAKFTDTLPTGLQVAATPSAGTTCTGSPTWAPAAGATVLTFGNPTGANIPASGSCTVSVNVTATTSGPHNNVSGFLSTTEGGTNTGSVASASLTAVLPPVISKRFAPTPILANGTSTLTFTISNPNLNDALGGIAFADTLPTSPGNMVVANPPSASTSGCGSPTFSPSAGAGSIAFSGGTIAAGGTCTVTVNITAPAIGAYNNTSGNVSFIINSATVNGNTASASMTVNAAHPAIAILKQVSTGATGPWTSFVALQAGVNVYYRFTIENIGDVPLNPVTVSDPTLAGTSVDPAGCIWTNPLPVASPSQDPTENCIKGPVTTISGSHPNTATSHGTYSSTVYNSTPSTATYATTGLTIAKSVTESSFEVVGSLLHYSYLVTNSGAAALFGPVTVADDKVSVTCPAVSTVGDSDNYLDPAESITCTAAYTITGGDVAAGSVTNTASSTVAGVTSNTVSRTVSYVPTLISLSDFSAFSEDGRFVVQWTTSSEIDTAGFYLFRLDEQAGRYRQINRDLLPALLTSQQGGTYSLIDNGASLSGSNTYLLMEVEGRGRKNTYGPFTVTAGAGNAVGNHYISAPKAAEAFLKPDSTASSHAKIITKYIDHEGTIVITAGSAPSPAAESLITHEVSDYTRTAKAVSSAKKAALNVRAGAKVASSLITKQKTGSKVKITIDKDGLYFLDSAEISSLLGLAEAKVRQMIRSGKLALTSQGSTIAYIPAEDLSGLFFYGQGIDNIYTKENIYWLSSAKGELMASLQGTGPAPAEYSTITETVHAEENKTVAPVLANGPNSDYWFWDYVIAGNPSLGTKHFDLQAFGVADASASAGLTATLHGVTATGVTDEHHVRISLNGTVIGEDRWKGTDEHLVNLSFSQTLLSEGTNSIEVKGLLDPGVPYSIFFVDSFDLTYQRLLQAHEDSLTFSAADTQPLTVYGFTSPDLFVFDITNPDRPALNMATTIDSSGSRYSVSFVPSPGARYLAIASDAAAPVAHASADSPSTLTSTKNMADYIIITTKELAAAAQELAAYRQGQGLKSMVVDLENIMDEFNYGISNPEAIRSFLSYAKTRWKKGPKYVLLAGDGTYDYKDNMGIGDNLVPTLMAETPQVISPSDNLYADFDGDHVPDIAIGRIPALTAQELRSVIAKIIAYESTAGSRVVMLADNPDTGGKFPADSDDIAALVPGAYSVSKIYLSEYTLSQARQLLFNEIQTGAVLINYTGHAGMDLLANEGLLKVSDVTSLQNIGKPFVLAAMTCTVGNFALPGFDSLSEALVTRDGAGAVAVWAPTGLSYNYLSKGLNEQLFIGGLGHRGVALGDVILSAFRNYQAAGRPAYIMDIFNLQGDPALRLW